jgi:DNA-directed RNA polymerase specialized sigma24 family protein
VPDADDQPLGTLRLDHISTRAATLTDASKFVLRYGPAVQRYIRAILRDQDAADETWQELVTNLLRRGGPSTWPGRGRFRDYLRMSARNAAITYLRGKNRRAANELPEAVAAPADRGLDDDWQQCLLGKVWRELDAAERRGSGNFVHTALRVYTESPELDSTAQAAVVSEKLGRPITAEAFRQQVRRGKKQMAERILTEVAGTIAGATADDVEAELTELGLIGYVRDYLPADWRTTFFGG